MTCRRRARALTVALVALTLATLVPGTAGAYHRDRQQELERLIRRKEQQIQQARAREHDLMQRIGEADRRRSQAQQALDRVEARLALARTRLRELELRLDRVAAELRKNTGELEHTLGLLHEKTVIFEQRVQQMYISRPNGVVALLEATRSFEDFAAVEQYLSSVADADMAALAELERTKAIVQQQRAEITRKQTSLEQDRADAARQTAKILGIRAERAGARNELARAIANKRAVLSEVRRQKAAYQRALASYRAESQDISAFLRGAQRGQNAIQGRGGWLKWPVSGRITSGYGWRTHPVYGYRSFHSGIDIGAPSGTTVKAARAGTVLYTGYRGAYGNVVLIDHGSSVATMYAHLSRFYVRPGERVSSLESVAAVGSTGWSTGPHLHFEVRVNGEPQNPMRWL